MTLTGQSDFPWFISLRQVNFLSMETIPSYDKSVSEKPPVQLCQIILQGLIKPF